MGGAVEHHGNGLVVLLPREAVNPIAYGKLRHVALAHGTPPLSELQEAAGIVIASIFDGGTSLRCKGIPFVVRPSSREILSQQSVPLALVAPKTNLVTIIKLWDASCKEENGQCLW